MLVFPDGRTVGTIGGGCYENDAFWKAKEALQSRKPLLVKYDLNDDFAQENGLVCGGQMQVYIEPLESTPRLYVIGALPTEFGGYKIANARVILNEELIDANNSRTQKAFGSQVPLSGKYKLRQ